MAANLQQRAVIDWRRRLPTRLKIVTYAAFLVALAFFIVKVI